MATIIWPNTTRGSTRPFGYSETQTVAGTTAKYIGVPSDVHQIGLQVSGVTTGYFLYGTMNTVAQVEADSAVYFDLLGNGSDAQTAAKQISIEGPLTAIKVVGSAGGAAATLHVEMRRV